MASTGHESTHTPQSTHDSVIMALPPFILIASLGHSPMHVSQPVHVSLFTFAGITNLHKTTNYYGKPNIIRIVGKFTNTFYKFLVLKAEM